jgi:Flp pilus assembly protein CpaB
MTLGDGHSSGLFVRSWMELEYRDQRRSRFVVGLGIILALFAGGAAYLLVSQATQQAGQAALQRAPAVVAIKVIPARQAIAVTDVELRSVPLDPTNANGIVTDPALVIGRIPAVSILQGQLITTNMLSSSAEGGRFSILGPDESFTPEMEDWRAVSMTVTDDLAVGGLLEPGQTVDVFVTAIVSVPADVAAAGKYYSDRSTKITYQDMVILAREDSFYVVKAPLEIAEEIVHLQASGTAIFSLVLRPDVDTRQADASDLGETTNRIISRYGIPVPESYPTARGPVVPTLRSPEPSTSPEPEAAASPGSTGEPTP